MAEQRIITQKYRDLLYQNAKDGVGLEAYSTEGFELDESRMGFIRGVNAAEGLCEQMDPEDDYKSAIAIYTAFKDIPRIVAGHSLFWEHLAHADLYSYVIKRWPIKNEESRQKNILNHWFMTKGMMRHSLASLWWSVKCSIDEEHIDDPFWLTRILMMNYSFRSAFYGASTFIRHKQITLGVLEFLSRHPELQSNFELTGRFITVYLNRIGSTKMLACLTREEIINRLEELLPDMRQIKSREDLKGNITSLFDEQD